MTDLREPLKEIELVAEDAPLVPVSEARGEHPLALKTVELPSELREDVLQPEAKRQTKGRLVLLTFILLVVLPTIAAGVYLFFVASDQYVAEARFAVRPADPIGGPGDTNLSLANADKTKVGALSSGSYLYGGDSLSSADAEIVANYIHSRAVIDDVSRTVDVKAIFRAPGADFFARLPDGASAEDLAIYWNRMVSVYIETTSGIVTLSVSAFRREDALRLTQAILKSSETLVNDLSRKVRADAMRTAEEEVRRSDGEVRFALASLTTFRNSNRLIDPIQSSEASAKLLFQLMSDKIETEAKLYVIQRSQGPNAPGINGTRAKLDSINRHVNELQDQMAGMKQVSKNLASTLAKFEKLELQKQFAERMYGFARDGVERARVAAIRQTVYLAVFMPPALPQEYTYPERWVDFFLIGAACLMVWVCGVTIAASIQDHRL